MYCFVSLSRTKKTKPNMFSKDVLFSVCFHFVLCTVIVSCDVAYFLSWWIFPNMHWEEKKKNEEKRRNQLSNKQT